MTIDMQFDILIQGKKPTASSEQVASGFKDQSGVGKYSSGHFPAPAYPSVNVVCSGYCDARSPAPKALAAKYGMPPSAKSVLKAKFGI